MSSEREDLEMHPARLRELRAHAEQNVHRGYGFVEFLSAGETLVLLDMIAAGWRPPTERTDAEVHADELLLWIDYCLSLPMYQNVISDFGQGVVETYRAARKVLIKGLHPDAARLATDRKGAES